MFCKNVLCVCVQALTRYCAFVFLQEINYVTNIRYNYYAVNNKNNLKIVYVNVITKYETYIGNGITLLRSIESYTNKGIDSERLTSNYLP